MADYQPNMVLSTEEFSVVGTRPIRHDGPDKVMGRARYAADIHLPGMLHGKILRSPPRPRSHPEYRPWPGVGAAGSESRRHLRRPA